MTKPGPALGTVHRGSVRHRILAELERYPDSWFRWYQFPELNGVHRVTIQQAFSRLVRDGLVEHRRVTDFDESASVSGRRPHGFRYLEIHHQEDADAAS